MAFGIVFRAWVNIDFAQRAEPTEIVQALNSLHNQRNP